MNPSSRALALSLSLGAVLLARGSAANAPTGHYTIGTGALAGTVYDTKSKLTWQQAAPSGTYTHASAVTYCQANAATLPGTGWRLPTAKELYSIVDLSQATAPLFDSTAFSGTTSAHYWSATLASGQAGSAWYGNFSNAYWGYEPTSTQNLVRCVR